MNNLSKSILLSGFLTLGLYAETNNAASAENPLAEMKIGERTYTKVYLESYSKKTGFAMLAHQWGAKKVKVEDLSDKQKDALGIKGSLTNEEIEANRAEKKKQRAVFLAEENAAIAAAEAEAAKNPPATASTSNSSRKKIDKSRYPKFIHATIDKAEKLAAKTGGEVKITSSRSG